MSDEKLIEVIGRNADAEAFRVLYRRYRVPIHAYLRRRLGDEAAAEDVCQEVFVGLLGAARRWEPRAKVSTLIYRIAANQAAKRTRSPDRHLTLVEDGDELESDANPGPEEEVGAGETAELVRRAIEQLEPGQRHVLLLNHYQGLSYAEVAEVLDLPIGTVRSRLWRAKAALRLALRELLSLEGGGA